MFKSNLRDAFYYILFLFRPMVIIGVSFAMLVITLVLLISVLYSVNQDSRIYEVLLAILTGLTASFVVSIIMESCNNYRFNSKRQRELRKYFKFISHYKMQQKIELKQSTEIEQMTSKRRKVMTEENDEKKKLIQHLNQVNTRLQLLDMIEERLVKMKQLAERVAGEDLTEDEIQVINQQVQELAQEVELLDTAPTSYTYKR